MTTSTNSTVVSHAGTTQFRTWGAELSGMLTTIGFIKSSDTGQINWASVTRPAAGSSGGYEIRYLNDSLHGTAPIYMKIEYGTDATGAAYPGMWITIGTGSNGSGTITGILIAREALFLGVFPLDSTVGVKSSYACMAQSCVWIAYKCVNRATYYPVFSWLLCRTYDSSGAATANGFVFYRTSPNGISYAPIATVNIFGSGFTASSGALLQIYGGDYALLPYGLSNAATVVSGVPGDYQVARHYTITPEIMPLLPIVSSSIADNFTQGSTMTITTVGSTSRTFIATRYMFAAYDFNCVIWE